jgi:hypothetical protein
MSKGRDSQSIFEAKKALADFLEKHPELAELQAQYEAHMAKAGPNTENRLIFFKQFLRDFLVGVRRKLGVG